MNKEKLRAIIEGNIVSGIIQFLILGSAVVFVLESDSTTDSHALHYVVLDWVFFVLFSIEYILRVYIEPRKRDFIFSFYGIIDLLAILPSLFLLPGFRILRILRFLRIFRIFKATRFILAVDRLTEALNEIRRELLALVILSLMLVYLAACGIHYFERVEQPEEFGSILDSMWWAIVTLTTVGYGDVYPITPGGKIFTALVTLVGVGLIAIPSGLLASVLTEARVERKKEKNEEDVENESTEGVDNRHENK
ncbi:MAG: ion transporter [Candidatus Poribacteria bacterium]|nr:ion transporter [Candidatus Poribacteria bacterium]